MKYYITLALSALMLAACATPQREPAVLRPQQPVASVVATPLANSPILKRKVAVGRFSNATNYGRALLFEGEKDPLADQAADMLRKIRDELGITIIWVEHIMGVLMRVVDRVMVLQSNPLFANATAAQLWKLSAIARELTLAEGAELAATTGDAAILVVLSGTLRVASPAGTESADAGDVIGLYATLAGTPFSAKVTATTASHLRRLERGSVFALLAEHTDRLQPVFSILLRSGRETSKVVSTP